SGSRTYQHEGAYPVAVLVSDVDDGPGAGLGPGLADVLALTDHRQREALVTYTESGTGWDSESVTYAAPGTYSAGVSGSFNYSLSEELDETYDDVTLGTSGYGAFTLSESGTGTAP